MVRAVVSWDEDVESIYNTHGRRRIFVKESVVSHDSAVCIAFIFRFCNFSVSCNSMEICCYIIICSELLFGIWIADVIFPTSLTKMFLSIGNRVPENNSVLVLTFELQEQNRSCDRIESEISL